MTASIPTSALNLDLTQLKLQARELRDAHRDGDPSTHTRIRTHLSRLTHSTEAEIREYDLGSREAQFVIARENGFESWAELKLHVETDSTEGAVDLAALAPMDEQQVLGLGIHVRREEAADPR